MGSCLSGIIRSHKLHLGHFMSTFPFSDLTLLVGRQLGHPDCKKLGVRTLTVTIWLELCTFYIAPVVNTHHLRHQIKSVNGDILVPANGVHRGKWPSKRRQRERESFRQRVDSRDHLPVVSDCLDSGVATVCPCPVGFRHLHTCTASLSLCRTSSCCLVVLEGERIRQHEGSSPVGDVEYDES